jgi:peptidoglycan/xylan/chitin deacetylase (PgdA/CDA1 family)
MVASAPVPENYRDVYVYHGRRSSNLVALTYDDGPNAEWTPRFMALLRELNCPATFFLLGESCERNPRTTAALATSEFEIGNHTINHRNLREADEEELHREVSGMQERLEEAGIHAHLFRPPYGNAGRRVVNYVYGDLGLEIIMWSIDTEDWRQGSTQQEIIDTILKDARGGSIILMHDRYEKSYEATRAIVPALRERGLEFVTISQMLEDMRTHAEEASGEAESAD